MGFNIRSTKSAGSAGGDIPMFALLLRAVFCAVLNPPPANVLIG
jgi:hypothetical protein